MSKKNKNRNQAEVVSRGVPEPMIAAAPAAAVVTNKPATAPKPEVKKEAATAAVADEPAGASSIVLAAIVILLILGGLGFLAFGLIQSINNQSRPTDNSAQVTATPSPTGAVTADGETDNDDETDNNTDGGSLNGGGISTEGDNGSAEVPETPVRTSKYVATDSYYRYGNDYKFGDITGERHVVKRGDTLWQIAEARYGTGYAWVDIDRANGGFPLLPNGTPVNMPVGYNLVLPAL